MPDLNCKTQHSSLAVKCFYFLNDRTDFSHRRRFNATATPPWQKYDLRRRQSFIPSDLQARRSRNVTCMLRRNEIDGVNIFYTTLESINQPQDCRRSQTFESVHGGCGAAPRWSKTKRAHVMSQERPWCNAQQSPKNVSSVSQSRWFHMLGWDEMLAVWLHKQCLSNADVQELLTMSPNVFIGAPITTWFKHFSLVETLVWQEETLKAKICFWPHKVIYIYPFRHIYQN